MGTEEDIQSTGQPVPTVTEGLVFQESEPTIAAADALRAKPKKTKRGIGYRITAGTLILIVVCSVISAALFGIALGLCGKDNGP